MTIDTCKYHRALLLLCIDFKSAVMKIHLVRGHIKIDIRNANGAPLQTPTSRWFDKQHPNNQSGREIYMNPDNGCPEAGADLLKACWVQVFLKRKNLVPMCPLLGGSIVACAHTNFLYCCYSALCSCCFTSSLWRDIQHSLGLVLLCSLWFTSSFINVSALNSGSVSWILSCCDCLWNWWNILNISSSLNRRYLPEQV